MVKINFHVGKNEFFSPVTRANFRASYTCTQITLLGGIRGKTCLVCAMCSPGKLRVEKLLFGAIRGLELASYPLGARRCIPRLSNLTGRAQCMRMSSIDMGLDYDSTVMLTYKLLFAAAKSYSS